VWWAKAGFGVVPVAQRPAPVQRSSAQTARISANLFTPFHTSLATLGPALNNWGGAPLGSIDECNTVVVPYTHTKFDADPLPPRDMDWNRVHLDDLRESADAERLPGCLMPIAVRYNGTPYRFDPAYWNGW
jgi:hypothetical protein